VGPEHPDHPLFLQIREGMVRLDAEIGRDNDPASERTVARRLPPAKQSGFVQVDHAVLGRHLGEVGENVFLVRGDLGAPGHLRAHVSTREAIDTPVAESSARLHEINRRLMLKLPLR